MIEWEYVGEINDVIMPRDGKSRAIFLDIGDFFGIGGNTVAVNMDELKFVVDCDDIGDDFIVFTSNRAVLEGAPTFCYDTAGN